MPRKYQRSRKWLAEKKKRDAERISVSTTEEARERGRPPRISKYNAKGIRINGIYFASAAEGQRYRQLLELENEGRIQNLEVQPSFAITVAGKHIAKYRADFRYAELDQYGRIVGVRIEDVKGMITDIYALKRKLVMAIHQIELTEIPARKVGEWMGRTA